MNMCLLLNTGKESSLHVLWSVDFSLQNHHLPVCESGSNTYFTYLSVFSSGTVISSLKTQNCEIVQDKVCVGYYS